MRFLHQSFEIMLLHEIDIMNQIVGVHWKSKIQKFELQWICELLLATICKESNSISSDVEIRISYYDNSVVKNVLNNIQPQTKKVGSSLDTDN